MSGSSTTTVQDAATLDAGLVAVIIHWPTPMVDTLPSLETVAIAESLVDQAIVLSSAVSGITEALR